MEPSVYIDVFHREKVGSERKYIEKNFFLVKIFPPQYVPEGPAEGLCLLLRACLFPRENSTINL